LPCPTITGSIRRDLVLIEQCIGAGEIAISDHRGTQPDTGTISDAAAECRVGGILSGKAGVMYCHIGTGSSLLGPLWNVVKETQVPIQTFLPTHMERSEALINDGAKWVKEGGYVDFTCRTLKVFTFVSQRVMLQTPV
jgi:beta-aspartyl-dipeptidase (metallo-type)